MSVSAFMKNHWPVLTAVGTGLMAWAVMGADISTLKSEAESARKDHDIIVELRTEQRLMQRDISEIKDAVKEIARENQ